ncbi:MAG: hypothetical protein J6Q96_01915 [Bacteroidales bacterium]|nr:hypothetical protein [Bacteroidales bacterium]
MDQLGQQWNKDRDSESDWEDDDKFSFTVNKLENRAVDGCYLDVALVDKGDSWIKLKATSEHPDFNTGIICDGRMNSNCIVKDGYITINSPIKGSVIKLTCYVLREDGEPDALLTYYLIE